MFECATCAKRDAHPESIHGRACRVLHGCTCHVVEQELREQLTKAAQVLHLDVGDLFFRKGLGRGGVEKIVSEEHWRELYDRFLEHVPRSSHTEGLVKGHVAVITAAMNVSDGDRWDDKPYARTVEVQHACVDSASCVCICVWASDDR